MQRRSRARRPTLRIFGADFRTSDPNSSLLSGARREPGRVKAADAAQEGADAAGPSFFLSRGSRTQCLAVLGKQMGASGV